ncbi:hypothetical protein CBS101457_006116 [Exobasidium rhododendri]|nr:hypothetical protein CBS101457_006116 [Exobasidium rhododendri]
MGNSSSKDGTKITSQDRAILDLKVQRDKIRQYQKRLQLISDRERDSARAFLVRGDKERAKTALRRRRYQETLLEKTDGQLETLEGLVTNIEFSQIEASVVHGLAQGNAVLKEIHKEMTVENVEKLMEETAEAQAYQREIDEALASKMTAEDEEAVNLEMAQLESEAEGLRDGLTPKLGVQPTPEINLPSAPQTAPVGQPAPEVTKEEVVEERQALLA